MIFETADSYSNMTRTRLLLGCISILHGVSALLLQEGGIIILMQKGTWEDFTWPIGLIICGGLMGWAAAGELLLMSVAVDGEPSARSCLAAFGLQFSSSQLRMRNLTR